MIIIVIISLFVATLRNAAKTCNNIYIYVYSHDTKPRINLFGWISSSLSLSLSLSLSSCCGTSSVILVIGFSSARYDTLFRVQVSGERGRFLYNEIHRFVKLVGIQLCPATTSRPWREQQRKTKFDIWNFLEAMGLKTGGYRAAKITMVRKIQSARKITPIKRKIREANLRR